MWKQSLQKVMKHEFRGYCYEAYRTLWNRSLMVVVIKLTEVWWLLYEAYRRSWNKSLRLIVMKLWEDHKTKVWWLLLVLFYMSLAMALEKLKYFTWFLIQRRSVWSVSSLPRVKKSQQHSLSLLMYQEFLHLWNSGFYNTHYDTCISHKLKLPNQGHRSNWLT